MRSFKDLFFEEYWEIAFRDFSFDNSVVDSPESCFFRLLKADKRYWYADPFLFEHNNRTYLFVEMFDNQTETGVIGVSEYTDGAFTSPEVVLKEKFHLSYPFVFEKDGDIYMMPETHEDNCIQLYKATDFPKKWEKDSVLINNINAVDTVIREGYLISSVICPENDMSVDLCIFSENGSPHPKNPVFSHSLTKRGAGSCFIHNNKALRPSQNCQGRVYGQGLIFNRIDELDNTRYSESVYSEISPCELSLSGSKVAEGIHTYSRTDSLEVVDVKFTRFNLYRFFYILKRKLF